MKSTWSAIISLILVAAFAGSLVVGIMTERQETAEPPQLEVGSWWSYQTSYRSEDGEQIMSSLMEVTGDSGDHWLLNLTLDPLTDFGWDPRYTIEEATMEVAKTTFLPYLNEKKGMMPYLEDYESGIVKPYQSHTIYDYTFLDDPLWPLSVAHKVRILESSNSTTAYVEADGTHFTSSTTAPSRSRTLLYNYEVEAVESVTVPAGTFRCFKILKYVEGLDTGIETMWYSPDVKNWVKKTEVFTMDEYQAASTMELQSYSLEAR